MSHFSLFKPTILNAIEIIKDKKKKRADIDTINDYITRTEASNADKTLIENVVRESSDQTIPHPTQVMNATKIPYTEDIETAPNSPLILNDILTPDTKIKQTTSFSNSYQESFSSLKSELCELKLSLTNEICEIRNSIRDIKAKTDVHSEQVKDNKRLWDELETENTIIKLIIDNFKQLADSISKPNTTVPLLQTPDFSENSNFILPKKYAHKESYDKSKPTNILSPNRYQLLKPSSENTESVSENIQNTDALRLPGNENKSNRNKNVLTSRNTGNNRPSVVINKYPERQTGFSRPPVVTGTKLISEGSLHSKVKETF